jgi:TonB family protein
MKPFFLLTLILFPALLLCQENKKNEYRVFYINGIEWQTNGKDTICIVDPMPEFPGGKEEMNKFIIEHLKYPVDAKIDNIQGQVIISFTITAEGNIINVKILKGVRDDINNEAIKVIELMPKWKPGQQHGKNVSVNYSLPINFAFEKRGKHK